MKRGTTMNSIYVVGVSMTKFGPRFEDTIKTLTREAVSDCLNDAGAEAGQIDAAFFANNAQGFIEGQVAIPGQIALAGAGISGIPISNIENGCASGSTAFWLARNHLLSGQADIVLAVGAEKLAFDDKEKALRAWKAFEGGMDITDPAGALDQLKQLTQGHTFAEADGHRTVFMDIYTQICRAHMIRFGSTQQQLAMISAKNHYNSTLNPKCHYNKAFSVEQILAARSIGYPLTVPMCSPLSDGAAAILLCTDAGLEKLSQDTRQRAVKVLSSVLTSATHRQWDDFEQHLVRRAAKKAYQQASIMPADINVAEVHDAAAFGELFMSELLGFCELGKGGELAVSGATALTGNFPINPSGGLESKGHPVAASGIAQLFELVTQLRGEAGARQVQAPRYAIQENGGGLLGVEEASAVVTILSNQI